jgi:hypothetical protein
MIQERRDLIRAELARMSLPVEHDEATNPLDVTLLRPPASAPNPEHRPHLIEKSRRSVDGAR